jgi:tetratricopeptide (TPR) repeat protein
LAVIHCAASNYFTHGFLMNNTLKSSNLVPLNGKPENTLEHLQHSLALIKSTNQPDLTNQQQKKAIAQIYVEQAWIYFQDRHWREAIAACKNALHLNPQNTDAYKILGNILKIKGKKAEALGVYAKALEINPNSAPIYANLGSFHADQKNWQQALDYYQQAVIIDPNFAGAYRSLARIWEELGESKQALECLCQAVNLEPEKFSATEYFNFGDRLYAEGKLKEASIFYIQGVELNPQATTQLAQLVKILEELEEWQQAVIFYHKLISLSNGESADDNLALNKPIKHLLSQAKSANQTKRQVVVAPPQRIASSAADAVPPLESPADNQSRQTLQPFPPAQQPNSASSWNNLGSSYAQKQQWVKAISCYQEAVELDPHLSKTYRNLARAYGKIEKQDQAILCWYEAFNLEPDLAKPQEHFSLARQLLKLEQVDQAIACLRHAIKLDPNFVQAYVALGKLLNSQGKIAEAEACYARVGIKN